MSSEIVYQAVLPLEPRSKKNSQRIIYNKSLGRSIIIQSDEYKRFEKDCGKLLTRKPKTPIDFPVNCQYIMYRSTERVFDGLNGSAALDDILVKYGILKDDNFHIVVGHDGTTVRVDRKNPRVEITITKIGEDEL